MNSSDTCTGPRREIECPSVAVSVRYNKSQSEVPHFGNCYLPFTYPFAERMAALLDVQETLSKMSLSDKTKLPAGDVNISSSYLRLIGSERVRIS